MAIWKHYLGHYAGEEVRWYYGDNGNIKLSNETGILKGWDDSKFEYIIKTNSGEVRANLICNEAERLKFFEDIKNAYKNGFRDCMKYARENV